ncbi:lactonase family protein [Geothrix oryzisoli]|uniref:lactonase family protein n=1 Tax=Geothrix oryzisoli TaxID=2922721 RepID=UPI001FAC42D3|nr:beta-propeller fold lactonase family protein [Geothrix oryzisoli]
MRACTLFKGLPILGLPLLLACGGGGAGGGGKNLTPGYAYVVNSSNGSLWSYSIDPTTGALSSIGNPVYASSNPQGVALDRNQQFLYVACSTFGSVDVFSFDAATHLPKAVTSAPTSAGSSSLALSPDGAHVYAGGTAGIYTFATSASGTLTSTGAVVATGTAYNLAIDPLGRVLVSGDGSAIRVHALNPTTGQPSSTPTVLAAPQLSHGILFHPNGKTLYVVGATSTTASQIQPYTLDASGNLASLAPVAMGAYPWTCALDPTGRWLFVANADRTITTYAIDATGAPTQASVSAVLPYYTRNLAMTPDGKFLFDSFNTTYMGIGTLTMDAGGALHLIGTSNMTGNPAATVFR